MQMRGRLVFVGCLAVIGAAAAPLPASASGSTAVTAGGGPATYSSSVGPGQPDAAGPPAPAPLCVSDTTGCDRETVTLTSTSPSNTLSFTVTYTPIDVTNQDCLDIAIEDSAATVVLAHQTCAPSGTTITDPDAAPGNYTLEVDSDGVEAVGASTSQTFTGSVQAAFATVTAPSPTPTPDANHAFGFTHEISVDIQHGDGEPDLAISNDNNSLFTGQPYGFSTTVSLLYKSSDGGVQWNNLHGSAVGEVPPCPNPVALVLRPDCSRGGGDAEVQFSSPDNTGHQRVQFVDLNGLDSLSCAYSDNGGDTFTDLLGFAMTSPTSSPEAGGACNEGGTTNAANPNCAQDSTNPSPGCATLGTDRQWMQVWPKADSGKASDQLYMTFDTGDQPPSGDAAIFSTDDGASWQVACTTTSGASCVGGANGAGSRPGPLVINPTLVNTISGVTNVTDGSYPTLYEFMGTNNNGTEVNISCDGGQTWSHVTTSSGQAGSTTNDFVAGAMDSNGELYTAYTVANDPNPWRVWFAHSTDGGKPSKIGDCSVPVQGTTWSQPVALTGPPSSSDGVTTTPIPSQTYAVMPWLTAGSAGGVDLVYYGTSQPVPFSPDSNPATWYLHMAQTLDGGNTWTDEQASETPMHSKSICFSGIGCTVTSGDRNLLDFFQVKLDSSGRALIIYTDDNNTAACPTCTPGIGLISEVQQDSGPSLKFSGGSPTMLSGLNNTYLQLFSKGGDVRQAGVNAEVSDPCGDALLAPPGHNLGQPAPNACAAGGNEVPAADITDLKVCLAQTATCPVANTAPNTAAFLFTMPAGSLSGGPGSAVVTSSGSLTANWLVTWRAQNPSNGVWDVWYAQAVTDPTGTLSCTYGRPLSVFNDGEPKAAEYVGNPESAHTAGCVANATNNTIEIDVPFNTTSGLASSSELFGLTGWTGNATAALDPTACSQLQSVAGSDCSGTLGFFNNVDETAPLDVLLANPQSVTPEAPSVPLLIGLGAVAILAGGWIRTRRRRPFGGAAAAP